ncbi:hypothetical protein T07_4869 [Trichinella nelsoni]|uniref:Uncharacterized protein n=1 Tax=Trichinella nelsoni TaxID=6336 RepID=A0A0V0S9N2_9BILA|nr:hypothetical protein T07_4869 [Trichinella nelsoni]
MISSLGATKVRCARLIAAFSTFNRQTRKLLYDQSVWYNYDEQLSGLCCLDTETLDFKHVVFQKFNPIKLATFMLRFIKANIH